MATVSKAKGLKPRRGDSYPKLPHFTRVAMGEEAYADWLREQSVKMSPPATKV